MGRPRSPCNQPASSANRALSDSLLDSTRRAGSSAPTRDVNRGMTAVQASEHLLVAGFDAVVEFLSGPFPQLSEQRAGILARRGDPGR